eukprot:g4848.t1
MSSAGAVPPSLSPDGVAAMKGNNPSISGDFLGDGPDERKGASVSVAVDVAGGKKGEIRSTKKGKGSEFIEHGGTGSYGALDVVDPSRARDASKSPRRMNVTRAHREKQLLRQQRKEFQVTSKFEMWCLCSTFVYFGLVISTYVAFIIPLEAMRMAPTWQSGFIIVERMIYGGTHIAAPVFGMISDNLEHPWGKRRPVLAAGAVTILASHIAMLVASSNLWVPLYLISLVFAMTAKNLVLAITASFLADVVPRGLTSTVSALTAIQVSTGCLIGFFSQYAGAEQPVGYTYVLIIMLYLPTQGIFFMVAREPRTDLSVFELAGEEDVEFLPEGAAVDEEAATRAARSGLDDHVAAEAGETALHENSSGAEPDAEAAIAEPDAEAPATHNKDDVNAKRIQSKEAPDEQSESTSERAGGDRSLSARMKYAWNTFYTALTISRDYGTLTFVRVCFYAGASSMSMILFFMRDAVGVPTRAEGVHRLGLVAMLAQFATLIIAVPASFIFTESNSRASTQKAFMLVGIFLMIVIYSAMSMLPELQASGISPGTTMVLVYAGGVLYGVSNCVVNIGDLGLALRILPAGVGHGSAMALFGPSTTYGYVLGSVIIGTALSFFAWKQDDEDKPHFGGSKAGTEGGALPEKKPPGDDMSKNLDFEWEVGYKVQGYQVIFLCSIVLLVISSILLFAVNTRRAERAAEGDSTLGLSQSLSTVWDEKDESSDEGQSDHEEAKSDATAPRVGVSRSSTRA